MGGFPDFLRFLLGWRSVVIPPEVGGGCVEAVQAYVPGVDAIALFVPGADRADVFNAGADDVETV